MEVYCYDGPASGETKWFPEHSYRFSVGHLPEININHPPSDLIQYTHEYQVHRFQEVFYRRVPKLGMVDLRFERKLYVACVNEPPTEIDPELLGDWELVEEADFVDDHQQWFAEKCYKYGMLTENEIW